MSGTSETPGMDEIRASISRIIADDEQARVATDTPAGAGPAAVHALRPVLPPDDPAAAREPVPPAAAGGLLSTAAEEAAGAAFAELDRSHGRTPRSLEDTVADMLKPMLKAWLDENLPAMVERLVREEIERVSRTRR